MNETFPKFVCVKTASEKRSVVSSIASASEEPERVQWNNRAVHRWGEPSSEPFKKSDLENSSVASFMIVSNIANASIISAQARAQAQAKGRVNERGLTPEEEEDLNKTLTDDDDSLDARRVTLLEERKEKKESILVNSLSLLTKEEFTQNFIVENLIPQNETQKIILENRESKNSFLADIFNSSSPIKGNDVNEGQSLSEEIFSNKDSGEGQNEGEGEGEVGNLLDKTVDKPLDNYNMGRWTPDEHHKFIQAMYLYGNEWKRVQEYIGSRSSTQARSHAQKFFIRLRKKFNVDSNCDEEAVLKKSEKIIAWIRESIPENIVRLPGSKTDDSKFCRIIAGLMTGQESQGKGRRRSKNPTEPNSSLRRFELAKNDHEKYSAYKLNENDSENYPNLNKLEGDNFNYENSIGDENFYELIGLPRRTSTNSKSANDNTIRGRSGNLLSSNSNNTLSNCLASHGRASINNHISSQHKNSDNNNCINEDLVSNQYGNGNGKLFPPYTPTPFTQKIKIPLDEGDLLEMRSMASIKRRRSDCQSDSLIFRIVKDGRKK